MDLLNKDEMTALEVALEGLQKAQLEELEAMRLAYPNAGSLGETVLC